MSQPAGPADTPPLPWPQDEQLLWQGRPVAGLRLTKMDFFTIAVAGLVYHGVFTTLAAGEDLRQRQWFAAVAVSLYLVEGLLRHWRLTRTFYALGVRSALIQYPGLSGPRLESYPYAAMHKIRLYDAKAGSGRPGSIWFGRAKPLISIASHRHIGFEHVSDATRVHQILVEAKAGRNGGANV